MRTYLRYVRLGADWGRPVFVEEMIEYKHLRVDNNTWPLLLSAVEVDVDKMKAKTTKATMTKTPPSPATTDVPDYTVVRGLEKSELPEVAARINEITKRMAELKKEADDLKAIGAEMLLKAKVKSVMCGELRVTRVDSSNSFIKRDLLLKYGVDVAVIDKSTKRTPYTTLKVSVKTEKGEGEE